MRLARFHGLIGLLCAMAAGSGCSHQSPAAPKEQSARAKPFSRCEMREGGIIRGPRAARRLALAFTGHGYAEGADTILNTLAARHARASFFLTGDFLENSDFQLIVRRVIREGHYLGPHSDKHLLYCGWEAAKPTLISREVFHKDLLDNLKRIDRHGVPQTQVRFFLPAYEHYNQQIVDWTGELGLTLVNLTPGTRAAADYTSEAEKNFVSSAAIFESIVARERQDPDGLNGFILLLHLGSGPGRADKFHDSFGRLVEFLLDKDYCLVRIDELLGTGVPGS